MIEKYTTKSFDFFRLRYVAREKNDIDYSKLDLKLNEHYNLYKNKETTKVRYIKCKNTLYIGITEISKIVSKIDENNYYWVFNLSKVDTEKEAIVGNIDMDVTNGRKVYAGEENEGPSTDTVVIFNPHNGIVVIPRSQSGVGKELLCKYFYKISRKQGAILDVVVDYTDIDNLKDIDNIKSVEYSIYKIVNPNKLNNELSSANKSIKTMKEVEASKLLLTLSAPSLNIKKTVDYIKKVLSIKENKNSGYELKKMLIKGENGDDDQIIDLISNRLIFVDNQVELNNNGKLLINSMIKSIKKAYSNNSLKIEIIDKNLSEKN